MTKFFHENKLGLSVIGLVIGIPLILISVFSLIYSNEETGILYFSYNLLGDWAFWIIIPGLIMFILGFYFVFDFFRKLKEFNSLMTIESKAKFIKNADRIEFLAWSLHPKYEKIVIDKKKKYKMR